MNKIKLVAATGAVIGSAMLPLGNGYWLARLTILILALLAWFGQALARVMIFKKGG